MTKDKKRKRKKNAAGFMEKHLQLLLNYCFAVRKNPKLYFAEFHRAYSSYSRTSCTIDVIEKAYERKVITGPELFVNSGIEVNLLHDVDNPLEFFEQCKKDERTTLAVISDGYWPILWCKSGANTLQYYDAILPFQNNGPISDRKVDKIFFNEKGILSIDKYPHAWFEEQWNTYYRLKFPREVTFREAAKDLGVTWVMVREYLLDILKQCKVITNFFPLGNEAYSPLIVTFKTDYETGIVKGLKTLNRTTYLYKAENTLILFLCISPTPRAQNHITGKFHELKEIGVIRDLHISTPFNWYKAF
ncbi:MAG: hypothetical protein PVF58_12270 [Candidatus Methanofastidiosia archaeon]|jgi:hypothetical protein